MMNLIILPITVSLLSSNSLSRFVFPEDNEVEHSVQKCDNGEDFCEHLPSYPAAKIAKAMQKEDSAFLRSMLKHGNDKTTPTPPRSRTALESGINLRTFSVPAKARTQPELEYEKVCQSQSEDKQLQAAKNRKGQYRFIVNGGEGLEEYHQTVTISKCVGGGLSCNVDSHDDTECRQEYIEHKLVVYDPSGQQLANDIFPLPSGCSCYKKPNFL